MIHEDGSVRKSGADDNASTKGMVSPPAMSPEDTKHPPLSPGIPVIKVSTESDRDRELADLEQDKTDEKGKDALTEAEEERANGDTNPIVDTLERAAEGLERPSQAAASDESKDGKKDGAEADYPETEGFSFANKRLCERWLDNLFMCLYEVSQKHLYYRTLFNLNVTS